MTSPVAVSALMFLTTACAAYRGMPVTDTQGVPDAGAELAVDRGPASVAQGQDTRLLIRRASMELEVEDPSAVGARVTALARAMGGYVERSSESTRGGLSITVRVPAQTLDAAMDSVAQLGRVKRRDVREDDVTERVVDLDARVVTLRATRDRLRQLLERANSIPEVITVEREMARVQAELDSLEARLKYLRSASALAELSVDADREPVLGPLSWVAVQAAKVIEKLFIWRY